MDSVDTELARLGTVLVEERVLRRVIKGHRKLRGAGLQVPHGTCYTLPRAQLEQLVETSEVGVDLATLPERVIVVAAPRAELAAGSEEAWSRLWRVLFHARVHLAFDEKLARREMTTAAIRERVNRVGQTEFDEIRSVLKQEDLLLPPVDDTAAYVEFVALYLELHFFAPSTLERTFPALFDTARVDRAIALDLDAAALLAASRPAGAPATPIVAAVVSPDDDDEPRREFVDPGAHKPAARARAKGNRSRAAILAARSGDEYQAKLDLAELSAHLGRILGAKAPPSWAEALLPVAHHAAIDRSLRFSAGARLLHDLQTACVVAEREVKVVDAFGWAISRGKRPIVRSLPATREVRVAKHVHAAVDKVAACALGSSEERAHLFLALHEMADHAEARVRDVVRPKIEAALTEVGLQPHSLPERVAQKKLVDELLDRVVTSGRLSLGHLRDAISKNDLKMPNLKLAELKTGDQMLRADRILAHSLDGVHRRGEAYMRFLQKVSSVAFGTRVGRFLTLYLMLPLLGSFAVVEGLQHMVGPLWKKIAGWEPLISTRWSLLGGAGFLFLLLHVPPFRRAFTWVLKMIWRGVRFVLWDAPRALWRHPIARRVLDSPITRVIVRPAIPAGILALAVPGKLKWPIAGGVFLLAAIFVSTRFGRLVEEHTTDWVVRWSRHVTSRIIPGLVKYVLDLFVKLTELFERGIYRVDEWLRFKVGQSRVMLVVKGALGTIWFMLTYFLRLYFNLFVEPTVNPIKHFPVVTVAAKIIIPIIPAMLDGISGPATALMGPALGKSFAALTVIVLPGLAGFLVWELKENWKLYRATRAKAMSPQVIGHHGETMVRFLRPGFHSGTIPKHYMKLRRSAWKGDERGVTKQREGLHHVEEAIFKFADRQLVTMLNEVASFSPTDVALTHVEIGSNRVQIELACPSVGRERATLRFEMQSGWLVGNVAEAGWIDHLDDAHRSILEIALAGFYKLSGVELVREQLEHVLRADADEHPPYDIADEGLLVWPGHGYDVEAVYDLRARKLTPVMRGETEYHGAMPDLGGRHALFFREPLYWSVWFTAWQQIARGEQRMSLLVGPSLLPRPGIREAPSRTRPTAQASVHA